METTTNTGREALYQSPAMGNYEKKEMTAFHALSQMAPNTVIEGYYKGRFESKKKPGAFFIVIEDEATGEAHGYGTCMVLDERIKQFHEKAAELGQDPKKLIFSTTFLGRLPNKNNSRTSYKFTGVDIYKPKAQGVSTKLATVTTEEVPF